MTDETHIPPELSQVLASYEANRRHTARAAAAILPGSLLRAFSLALDAGGLRAPTLGDFALLAQWEHPLAAFVEDWLAGQESGAPEMTSAERDLACCLWRTPWADALESAQINGRVRFRGHAPEFILSAEQLCAHLVSAFATGARMKQPGQSGEVTVSAEGEDGLGWWLNLFGFATGVLGLTEAEALGYPLARLIARRVWRDRSLGMEFSGASYILQEEEARQAREAKS